jgi:hypothetical protein
MKRLIRKQILINLKNLVFQRHIVLLYQCVSVDTHTAATNEGHNERKLHNQERNIQQVE